MNRARGRLTEGVRGRVLALVCLILALLPPAVAYAASYTYATGVRGVYGDFNAGWNSYWYNQVWHARLYYWRVYYKTTDGRFVGDVTNYDNPTQWPNSIGYGQPHCQNISDNSGVTWTCQYGRP